MDVDRIVVLPYFLTLGVHLQRDLPAIVDRLRPIYIDVEFTITEPLDGHPALLDILIDRYQQVVSEEGNHSEGKTNRIL